MDLPGVGSGQCSAGDDHLEIVTAHRREMLCRHMNKTLVLTDNVVTLRFRAIAGSPIPFVGFALKFAGKNGYVTSRHNDNTLL